MQPDTAKTPLRNKHLDKTMEKISSHLNQLTKSLLDSLGSEKIKEKCHD